MPPRYPQFTFRRRTEIPTTSMMGLVLLLKLSDHLAGLLTSTTNMLLPLSRWFGTSVAAWTLLGSETLGRLVGRETTQQLREDVVGAVGAVLVSYELLHGPRTSSRAAVCRSVGGALAQAVAFDALVRIAALSSFATDATIRYVLLVVRVALRVATVTLICSCCPVFDSVLARGRRLASHLRISR